MKKMHDLISIKQLSKQQILDLLVKALEIKQKRPDPLLQGRILASCFFEPSTRTRLSFESAMKRLGGEVIGFCDQKETAMQKGESLQDTIKVMGKYADVLVIRHPLEGAAQYAANATDKPVINAGDGSHEHPTQTLLDLFTIHECHNTLEQLQIAFVGDLLYGRTVHSLVYALKLFNVRLYFVSPSSLSIPDCFCAELKKAGTPYTFHTSIDEVIAKADILYMTRIQKERFSYQEELKLDPLILTAEKLAHAKPQLKVLHPLPRLQEIESRVDTSPHAYYFTQAENGLYIRQALLNEVLK